MAFYILSQAYRKGILRSGELIIEVTSGNTGISFAGIGKALGHPVMIFMPDWMSQERVNLLKSYGAQIKLVSKSEGGFLGSIQQAEEMAASVPNAFLPRQFANEDNVEAYASTTSPEIWWQLRFQSKYPQAFVAGVGTGGTIRGVGRFLKKMNPGIKIHPLEPANSPTLSTGHKIGQYRI